MNETKRLTDEEKAALAKKEYMRDWRKKNAEKVKEYNKNFWLKKANEMEGVK